MKAALIEHFIDGNAVLLTLPIWAAAELTLALSQRVLQEAETF